MNLMMNSIDAMKDVDGTRELAIKSHRTGNEQLMVCVSDFGVGLPPQQADQIFHAFFTTKPHESAWDWPSAAPSMNRMAAFVGCRQFSARREFSPHSTHQLDECIGPPVINQPERLDPPKQHPCGDDGVQLFRRQI